MTNPTVLGTDGNYGGGPLLGNYAITSASSARALVAPGANFNDTPPYDFFDKPRKSGIGSVVDAGAVQISGTVAAGPTDFTVSVNSLDFGLTPDRSPTTVDNSGGSPRQARRLRRTLLSKSKAGPSRGYPESSGNQRAS